MTTEQEMELVVGAQPFGVSVVSHEPGRSILVRYRPYLGMYLLSGLGACGVGLLALALLFGAGIQATWALVVVAGAAVFWAVMTYYLVVASRADLRIEDDVAQFRLAGPRRVPCDDIGGIRCVVQTPKPGGPGRILVGLQLDPEVLDTTSARLKPYLAEGSDAGQPYYTALRLPCPDEGEARQVAGVLEKALVCIWESGDES